MTAQRLFKTTAIVGSSTVLTMLIGVVRAKVVAVFLGPEGAGLLGNAQVLLTFFEATASLGVGAAVIRFIRENEASGEKREPVDVFGRALGLNAVTALGSIVVSVLLARQMASWTLGSSGYGFLLLLVLLRVPLTLLYQSILGLLTARDEVKTIGAIAVLSSVFTVIITVPLIAVWGVEGGLVSYLVNAAALLAMAVYYFKRYLSSEFSLRPKMTLDGFTGRMIRYGVFAQVGVFANSLGQYLLRLAGMRVLGVESMGFFNSAAGLALYLGVFQSSLGVYFAPRVAELVSTPEALRDEVNKVFRFHTVLVTPILIGVIAIADVVALVFLSRQFIPIIHVVPWLLLAALIDLLWAITGAPLLVMERFASYTGAVVAFNLAIVGLSTPLATRFGAQGLAFAVLASEVLVFLLFYLGGRRAYGLRLTRENWALLVCALVIGGAAGILVPLGLPFRLGALAVAAVWVVVTVRDYEWAELRRLVARTVGAGSSEV